MKVEIHREHGNFRLAMILFVAMAGCLWSGGQGVYTALKNRAPVTLNYGDLERGKPSAHWLVLTNCVLAVHDSAYLVSKTKYETGSGRITEAFVPLHSPDQNAEDRCFAVLATKDQSVLALLEELRRVNNETEYAQFIVNNRKQLVQRRQVEGLVRFGAEESHGEQTKLAGLKGNLSKDYIILAEGVRPSMKNSLGLVLLGLLIGGGMFLVARSKSEVTTENY